MEGFFKFPLLSHFSEVIHGISSRNYGEMKFGKIADNEVVRNRRLFLENLDIDISEIVVSGQVHGSKIVICGENEKGKGAENLQSEIAGVDGFIATEANIFPVVLTADCLPVLFYDPLAKIIGICHAGWQGVVDQIVPKMVDKFVLLGSDPENLIVGIGPGICQKHFVVRNDVRKFFLGLYPESTMIRNKDGYVDLKKAVMTDLKKAGVEKNNIEFADYCTYCDNGIFPSFRKEGSDVLRIMSIIGMRDKK